MSKAAKTQHPDAGVKVESRTTAAASMAHKVIKTKVSGTVQWFNVNDGYGFVKRSDTAEDVFVHCSAISSNHQGKYLCCVGDGQEVQFDIVAGRKGPQAANVTSPGGVPIQCKCSGVTNGEKRKVEGAKTKEDVKNQGLPKKPVPKVCRATTTEDLVQAHLEEFLKVKEAQEGLMEELEALKKTTEEERAALRADFEKDLLTKDETYRKTLESHKAACRREVQQQDARYREQLQAQKARFRKDRESKTEKSWIYIFGGLCLLGGFLSAKCLTN